MDTIDLVLAIALALCPVLLIGAVVAYSRTAYKKGGWKRVGRDLLIALGTIVVFAIERIAEHSLVDAFNK